MVHEELAGEVVERVIAGAYDSNFKSGAITAVIR
jgi:hypothetical protein